MNWSGVAYECLFIELGPIIWDDDSVLHIGFIGGDDWQKDQVKKFSVEWTKYTNIGFNFDTTSRGTSSYDILISFGKDGGSWSQLGTISHDEVRAGNASMNFGWITPDHREDVIRQTILHEFGHSLGLTHMHQNPWRVGFPDVAFDEEACKKHFKSFDNWDEDTPQHNVLKEFTLNYSKLSDQDMKTRMINLVLRPFDPHSIMMYQFDANLAEGGKGGTLQNWELSARDKYCIQNAYPWRYQPEHDLTTSRQW
ncbi:zincin [Setomelanomma holmii]|uniref:Zincin n=1 Tax=Setomelanomma holmii TaxID=210430 RepID=A0A9P4H2L4_9PLEO|nr:zincin [Setomelanomma holmii]